MNDKIELPGVFNTLAREHGLILRVLTAFEHYVSRLEGDAEVDGLELARFVTFFREYSDLTHHEREEEVLFPMLVEHGFANDYGPLAFIREQHGREREYLWQLMQVLMQREGWNADSRRRLSAVARDYVQFQRGHIDKESALLYPAARRELTASDLQRLETANARFDRASHRAKASWLAELGESLVSQHAR